MHHKLKIKAALEGMTVSEYLRHEVRELPDRSSVAELRARIALRPTVDASESMVDAVRAQRDAR